LQKKWKELSAEEKKAYEKASLEDAERARKEAQEFFAKRTRDQMLNQKLPPWLEKLDPLKFPSLPRSSYVLFTIDFFANAAHPDKKVATVAKQWKTLTEQDKLPFVKKTELESENFKKTWAAYKEKLDTYQSANPGPASKKN